MLEADRFPTVLAASPVERSAAPLPRVSKRQNRESRLCDAASPCDGQRSFAPLYRICRGGFVPSQCEGRSIKRF